jgi:hypothetical protein
MVNVSLFIRIQRAGIPPGLSAAEGENGKPQSQFAKRQLEENFLFLPHGPSILFRSLNDQLNKSVF